VPSEAFTSRNITGLLVDWSAGNEGALKVLLPLVYEELRQMADSHLRRESSGHTLQRTALVHEAFLRLVDQHHVNMRCRAQFFGLASQIMRNILVDHARRQRAQKRGGDASRVSLDLGGELAHDNEAGTLPPPSLDLTDVDRALKRLEQLDPHLSRIVEMRFFGSLSIEDTASALGVSAATVKREWASARAWLQREIGSPQP
jgi:RNA polymerase sigma factor (TIGR02999 family)